MRQWMVDPEIMCQKHLCGEHVEIHMFVGSMKRKISMQGYLDANLMEPRALATRHDTLAAEMVKRGYSHKTPLWESDVPLLPKSQMNVKIDEPRARADLLGRCPLCKAAWDKKYQESSE